MNWEVKKEVLAALENWLLSCFYAVPFWKEEYRRRVVQRLEEYVVMCEVARYLRREYKMLVFELDVEDGFWWDGEFMGKPTSCFITYSKAICDWGGRRWEFIVEHAPDGVYIKPDTPLVDRWIKVAHWETI